MTAINDLVIEGLTQPIRNFMHDVRNNPDKAVNTAINAGSLAAAIYHIYSHSKDKDDKISAVFNSIPGAARNALAVALAGHAISDLSRGRYSNDPAKNPYMKSFGNVNMNDMKHFQNLNKQQQQKAVNDLMRDGY